MENKEMIIEMLEMQKALDEAIYKGHNTSFNKDRCFLALIDEIGELTHELKSDWCWWKKTVKPKDDAKVLEELVDVWHFAMSIHNNINNPYSRLTYVDFLDFEKMKNTKYNIVYIINCLTDGIGMESLFYVIHLTFKLGYEIEDVYKAYIEKNKINYERLKGGY